LLAPDWLRRFTARAASIFCGMMRASGICGKREHGKLGLKYLCTYGNLRAPA
jgi:hypothetical protein